VKQYNGLKEDKSPKHLEILVDEEKLTATD